MVRLWANWKSKQKSRKSKQKKVLFELSTQNLKNLGNPTKKPENTNKNHGNPNKTLFSFFV
jgi:hypothetical protein